MRTALPLPAFPLSSHGPGLSPAGPQPDSPQAAVVSDACGAGGWGWRQQRMSIGVSGLEEQIPPTTRLVLVG